MITSATTTKTQPTIAATSSARASERDGVLALVGMVHRITRGFSAQEHSRNTVESLEGCTGSHARRGGHRMSTMRAVVVTGPGDADVLELAEVAMPSKVSAEFLVKVVAAGVNPIDAKTRA